MPTPFSPSPSSADAIIDALADPALALTDLAARHATTLEALTLWLTRPDIAERLESLHTFAITRTRFIATHHTPVCIQTLSHILTDFTRRTPATLPAPEVAEPRVAPSFLSARHHTPPAALSTSIPQPAKSEAPRSLGSATTSPVEPPATSPPLSAELRHRIAETARRAATRLLQLATFTPRSLFAPPRPQQSETAPAKANASAAPAARPPATNTQPLPRQPLITREARPASAPPNPPSSPSPPLPLHSLLPPQNPLPTLARPAFSRPNRSPSSLLSSAGIPTSSSTALLDLPLISRPHEHWP